MIGWEASMTNLKNTKQYGARGIATMELALVLPVLVLLALGTVELGLAIFMKGAVNSAAIAGVRYGAQNQSTAADNAGMIQKARNDAGTQPSALSGMTVTPSRFCECSNLPGTTVSCTSVSSPCSSGNRRIEFVQVVTAVTFQSLFHYPGLPQSFTMNGRAVMRVGL